jgi:hypothetical protein
MNFAHHAPRTGLPDRRVNAFAVKVSLLSTAAIAVLLHQAWDSDFWPLFFSPGYFLVTYLIGRFAGAERYAKQDRRTALASQAAEDARSARDAARNAEASARDSETVAEDAQRIARDRPVGADAARRAVTAATTARQAAQRAGRLAECVGDDAERARKATNVEQAARAAHQATADRHEVVLAAEEAATHAMTARQALEDGRSAIAREGASHEDLVKSLATAIEFLGFLMSPGIDPGRKDAICQNVARELLPVAIALRDPDTTRLAAHDGSIQSLLATLDARLSAQNVELPQAQLIFDALGYGRANQRPLS